MKHSFGWCLSWVWGWWGCEWWWHSSPTVTLWRCCRSIVQTNKHLITQGWQVWPVQSRWKYYTGTSKWSQVLEKQQSDEIQTFKMQTHLVSGTWHDGRKRTQAWQLTRKIMSQTEACVLSGEIFSLGKSEELNSPVLDSLKTHLEYWLPYFCKSDALRLGEIQ